jgi:hypothetical protein
MPDIMPVRFRIRIANRWHYWGFINGIWCDPPYNYGKVKKISDKDLMERSRLWTGMIDRVCMDIYQCDILSLPNHHLRISNYRWEVVWSQTSCSWGFTRKTADGHWDFLSFSELNGFENDCQIVGNSEVD